jgi:hypothetical protein
LAIAAAIEDWAVGVEYELGAKPPLTGALKPGARADCSGVITRWVARAGISEVRFPGGKVTLPIDRWHGSWRQRGWCRPINTADPVAYALGPQGIGCFLFMLPKPGHPGHVELSLGYGFTIGCRGGEGLCIVPPEKNGRRPWEDARKLPQLFETID